jgi:hypothetical protein
MAITFLICYFLKNFFPINDSPKAYIPCVKNKNTISNIKKVMRNFIPVARGLRF